MNHICLVAGGTGGHILPAIAFGEWIRAQHREVNVSFVCGSRPAEREIYEGLGLKPYVLSTSGSPFGVRGPVKKLSRLKELYRSYFEFKRMIKRHPVDACVLFGGYVSLVPLIACHLSHIPAVVHEQNGVAGRATRLSRYLGKEVASGWSVCTPFSAGEFHVTGIPVRKFTLKSPEEAWKELGFSEPLPKSKIVGVLGGSLISQRLIQLSSAVVNDPIFEGISFLILGALSGDDSTGRKGNGPGDVYVIEKQRDMSGFYSLIDAAVTRGGASTLAELATLGIPAVVVPWPQAADNHQETNACCFVEQNAGKIWREDEAPELLKKSLLTILRMERGSERPFIEGDESESLWRLISSSIGREII